MDIRDLSIGDFVQARMVKWDYEDLDITPPMRVVRIDKDCVRLGFSLDDLEFEVFVDDLQPIPITAEVLEKNGFRLVVVNKKFNDWHDKNITIRKYYNEDNYHLFVCGQKIEFKMLFIHQLQHALRLAGKEIEL